MEARALGNDATERRVVAQWASEFEGGFARGVCAGRLRGGARASALQGRIKLRLAALEGQARKKALGVVYGRGARLDA